MEQVHVPEEIRANLTGIEHRKRLRRNVLEHFGVTLEHVWEKATFWEFEHFHDRDHTGECDIQFKGHKECTCPNKGSRVLLASWKRTNRLGMRKKVLHAGCTCTKAIMRVFWFKLDDIFIPIGWDCAQQFEDIPEEYRDRWKREIKFAEQSEKEYNTTRKSKKEDIVKWERNILEAMKKLSAEEYTPSAAYWNASDIYRKEGKLSQVIYNAIQQEHERARKKKKRIDNTTKEQIATQKRLEHAKERIEGIIDLISSVPEGTVESLHVKFSEDWNENLKNHYVIAQHDLEDIDKHFRDVYNTVKNYEYPEETSFLLLSTQEQHIHQEMRNIKIAHENENPRHKRKREEEKESERQQEERNRIRMEKRRGEERVRKIEERQKNLILKVKEYLENLPAESLVRLAPDRDQYEILKRNTEKGLLTENEENIMNQFMSKLDEARNNFLRDGVVDIEKIKKKTKGPKSNKDSKPHKWIKKYLGQEELKWEDFKTEKEKKKLCKFLNANSIIEEIKCINKKLGKKPTEGIERITREFGKYGSIFVLSMNTLKKKLADLRSQERNLE